MCELLESPWGIVHIDPSPEAFDKLGLNDVCGGISLQPKDDRGHSILVLGVGIEKDSLEKTVIWVKRNEEVVLLYPEKFKLFKQDKQETLF